MTDRARDTNGDAQIFRLGYGDETHNLPSLGCLIMAMRVGVKTRRTCYRKAIREPSRGARGCHG